MVSPIPTIPQTVGSHGMLVAVVTVVMMLLMMVMTECEQPSMSTTSLVSLSQECW